MTDKTTAAITADKLTGEDARLDALLKAARPTADAGREALLLDRILAASAKTPRLASPAVVRALEVLPARPRPAVPQAVTRLSGRRDVWGAGGLLAASLVLGVFLGQASLSDTAVQRIAQVTGVTFAAAGHDLLLGLASADIDEDE